MDNPWFWGCSVLYGSKVGRFIETPILSRSAYDNGVIRCSSHPDRKIPMLISASTVSRLSNCTLRNWPEYVQAAFVSQLSRLRSDSVVAAFRNEEAKRLRASRHRENTVCASRSWSRHLNSELAVSPNVGNFFQLKVGVASPRTWDALADSSRVVLEID